jgi:ribosomal protein S13
MPLDWDSYIDCSKITPRDLKEIESAIKLKPEAIIGKLSHEDLEVIKQKIRTSPTIKGKHKKKFGFYK